jgi:hypothetical protein
MTEEKSNMGILSTKNDGNPQGRFLRPLNLPAFLAACVYAQENKE